MESRGLKLATAAVALHTVANVSHGVPHAEIPVRLATWQTAFVYAVALGLPLFALGLLGLGRDSWGILLLTGSMAASFLFGLYFHFLVANPDHVHSIPAGPWQWPFRATAVLVALTDALGVVTGVWLHRKLDEVGVVRDAAEV
ncbi:hypothetical protein [Halorussus halophilus]|uniref:hypothetical protein n=1 Tax=Halorussus halophilus TaxID=2650975 RepID=UPI001301521D|nr:hypothetical protein [Halorussus halophilus]